MLKAEWIHFKSTVDNLPNSLFGQIQSHSDVAQ